MQSSEQPRRKHRNLRRHRPAARPGQVLFPPDLIPPLRRALPTHPALVGISDSLLAQLLTVVFFGSLETEELEHHPIRIAFLGRRPPSSIPPVETAEDAASYRWRAFSFRHRLPCDAQHLRKLSRAALGAPVFAVVALVDERLQITGLAREGFRLLDDPLVNIVAPRPGCLEVWWGPQRVLEYVRGHIETPPENVLLAAGPVRRQLMAFAAESGVLTGYLTAVAGLVRQVAAHPYGGIVVLSHEDATEPVVGSGICFDGGVPICSLLSELSRIDATADRPPGSSPFLQGASARVLRSSLRTEIDRLIADIGRLTALDGATILDRNLGARCFGAILPVDPSVEVEEALDAEALHCVPFELEQHGARHRAAASYAHAHPTSVVFVVSVDGEVGCLLREKDASRVRLWRFRPTEVRLA